jgi:predicted small metal-binding protein
VCSQVFGGKGDFIQMPSFMCKDIGIDCPFEAHGSTENELMRKFIDHAEPAHKMPVLSADVIYKIRNAIKK